MNRFKILILAICFFVPFAFAGCENKNKETLSTPSIADVKGGTIVFDPIAGADYYTLSINDYNLNIDIRTDNNVEIIDNKINFDASNIFVIGESYSVKVKANAANKYNSNYSSVYSYRHHGNIKKPENLKINGSILTWDVVENASYYVIKTITPNDTIIFDKDGDILEELDNVSIERADLTEYTFNTNQFDFSSLLSAAGNYKFYVSAVLSAGSNYVESGYTSPINYAHNVTLQTPTNGVIKKVDDSLHMLTAIDANANAIAIECNGTSKTIEINSGDSSLSLVNDNLIDINLTNFFTGSVSLNQIGQFSFRTQAKFVTDKPENAFYHDSNFSTFVHFENTQQLTSPVLSISKDNKHNCFVANWECSDASLVSEYKLIVCGSEGLKEYSLSADINSQLIYDDFILVTIKAVGVGNYLSSNLSNFVSNPEITSNLQNMSSSLDNAILNWQDVADYYIVELGNDYIVTEQNTYEIDTSLINDSNHTVNLTGIKAGKKHQTDKFNLTVSKKLATPTFGYGQGFNGTNLYELTFTGVENAIGYYVYLKTKDSSTFEKIDTLYLTTTIDLTKYICSEGNYTDYEVKVQAVADIHGLYTNSALSPAVTVSHLQILNTPDFYKINDTIIPVSKTILGNSVKYTLKFYGVENAGSYEILINYNKINVSAKNSFYTGIYEVDISNYLIAANNYEIKVRALPAVSATNTQSSAYNVANYTLTKQLPMVQNINVTENEGIYTLSFDPVDNASSYRVRIIKENDANYVNYLNSLGLSNNFVVTQSVDVTQYVVEQGVYYFYVTALAPTQNSYYADATESTTYGYVSKLTTLKSPENIEFENVSSSSYLLSWTGDENADYYLVKITNPNNIAYEFKVYNATSTDVNKYITVQGDYTFAIYSMVNAVGENAKEFASSPATNESLRYIYQLGQDFERCSVYMYGSNFDFAISNANELKNILWYHYLYEIDIDNNLSIMLILQTKEDSTKESVKDAILRLATEANDSLLHNFNNDEQWLELVANNSTSDNELFSYLCKALLKVYPEFNILENFSLEHETDSQIFRMNYRNALNSTKGNSLTTAFANTNYGNNYSYIDIYSRKSATGVFAIDSREEMLVTTTEQLIQAIQHNRKPKFIGDSSTAETVYSNAKIVLSAIVTNNMSDLEKVTAIFDWLSASYDLTYYTVNNKSYVSGLLEQNNIQDYGYSKIYYLEGIFEDITMLSNGDIKIGNNLATSQSYSKAFALLCAIEGIDATVVNGTYSYYDTDDKADKTVDHVWNKVLLNTSVANAEPKWYAVDLTFSDNRIYFNNFKKGYGMSSHTYFLTSDSFAELSLKVSDANYLISSSYETTRACDTTYNYYLNSSYGLTYNQISSTIFDFEDESSTVSGFEYSLEFNANESYQKYSKTTGYGALQSYLLNTMIYSKFKADNNASKKSVFEFKFNIEDNNNSYIFDIKKLQEIFDSAPYNYSLKLRLALDPNNKTYSVEDSENKSTTIVFIVEKTA